MWKGGGSTCAKVGAAHGHGHTFIGGYTWAWRHMTPWAWGHMLSRAWGGYSRVDHAIGSYARVQRVGMGWGFVALK